MNIKKTKNLISNPKLLILNIKTNLMRKKPKSKLPTIKKKRKKNKKKEKEEDDKKKIDEVEEEKPKEKKEKKEKKVKSENKDATE